MNLATFSSTLLITLTVGLFSAGCGAEAGSTGGEGVEQGSQAATVATPPPVPAGVRTYPPHGYPCLGCHPCGDSYCDNENYEVVYPPPGGGSSANGAPSSK
jgi:hypothetical protein